MPETTYAYVGTYASAESDGIHVFRMEPSTGELYPLSATPAGPNPSFLAVEPRRPCLYAINEAGEFNGEKTGGVTAFSIDPKNGRLTRLNGQSSAGAGPCFVSVDHTGRYVLTANYGGGVVGMLPLEEDGSLKPPSDSDKQEGTGAVPRQDAPYAHSVNPDPTNRYAVAAFLGLDRLIVYRMDLERGKLAPNDPPFAKTPPGAGPRHLAFHPNGRYAFVINEVDSTLMSFEFDAERGAFREVQVVSTLPEGYGGKNSTAEVVAHPSGRFVYGSNRGHDSIAMFEVDPTTGRLTPIGHEPTGGKEPRNFNLDPAGRYLYAANQNSGTITVFRVDSESGRLIPTGHQVEVPTPVCVKFFTAGG